MAQLIMVAGGARSGKSAFAESRLRVFSRVAYIATLAVGDEEMRRRVALHRQRRPAAWQTLEAPEDVAGALRNLQDGTEAVLFDCLTGWLSNRLLAEENTGLIGGATEGILDSLDTLLATLVRLPVREIVVVTNETGSGIVPQTLLGRQFRDLQGWANQRLAAAADAVFLLQFGLAQQLK